MSDIPNDDKPGFVADKPEHCFACYRLILAGQMCFLTIEQSCCARIAIRTGA